jgi:hypothetical protein
LNHRDHGGPSAALPQEEATAKARRTRRKTRRKEENQSSISFASVFGAANKAACPVGESPITGNGVFPV